MRKGEGERGSNTPTVSYYSPEIDVVLHVLQESGVKDDFGECLMSGRPGLQPWFASDSLLIQWLMGTLSATDTIANDPLVDIHSVVNDPPPFRLLMVQKETHFEFSFIHKLLFKKAITKQL